MIHTIRYINDFISKTQYKQELIIIELNIFY